MYSYVKVVNLLFATYATHEIMAMEIKGLESYRQSPRVSAALYAKILYPKAHRCGIVYEEKRINLLFGKGQDASIYDNMRVYLGLNPHAPLTELARHVDKVLKIANRSARSSGESLKSRTAVLPLRPHKQSSYAFISIDKNNSIEAASTVSQRYMMVVVAQVPRRQATRSRIAARA